MASRSWAQPKQTSVVLLLTGVITDGGWSQLAFNGLKSLGPGFKTAYAENIGLAQMQEVARGYSDDGFDLILGHGFEFSSALLDIAPDYPSQQLLRDQLSASAHSSHRTSCSSIWVILARLMERAPWRR